MDRRTVISITIGALSVACAVGAFERDRDAVLVTFEPLADGGERSLIQGYVFDADSGKELAGALIILQCSCLDGQREVQTDAYGLYNFRNLPPGKYTVQVLYGQANVNRSFDVAPGIRVKSNFWIEPANKFVVT